MSDLAAWKIYYDDGSTFSSLEGLPHDAPGGGVIAIVQRDAECGYAMEYGGDFYIWYLGRWNMMDVFGLADLIIRAKAPLVIKLGRLAPKEDYKRVMSRAGEDLALARKSAFTEKESRLL